VGGVFARWFDIDGYSGIDESLIQLLLHRLKILVGTDFVLGSPFLASRKKCSDSISFPGLWSQYGCFHVHAPRAECFVHRPNPIFPKQSVSLFKILSKGTLCGCDFDFSFVDWVINSSLQKNIHKRLRE
jgi:hypothetical protein